MKNMTLNFLREEQGQDMVEYALVVGLIALACIASMGSVATKINGLWDALTAKIPSAL